MFGKFFIGFFCLSLVDGSTDFRFDYTFNNEANGWLKLHSEPVVWSDARLICHAEGAVLASPLTRELKNAILRQVPRSINSIFTGIHTTFAKGVHASIEGVPLSRMLITWAQGEPNNINNSESCLAMDMFYNGTMRDVKCSNVLPYVCYKKWDQALVVRSDCGTHDTEYKFESRTGNCFKFHRRGLGWHEAYRTCMAEGGHLVVINSNTESQVLMDIYANYPDSTIFSTLPEYASIGMFDAGDGGNWIHGQTPTEAGFAIWQPGEPNNGTQPRGEFCGLIHRTHPFLFDAPCDWIIPFICEKKPRSLESSVESYVP